MKKTFLTLIFAAMSILTFGQKWTAMGSDTPSQPQVRLISSDEKQIVVNFSLEGFNATRVETPNGIQNIITVPEMATSLIAGEPNLPHFPIPALIGDKAEMGVKVTDVQYTDFNIEVAPSKGNISRQIDPETVPYTYGEMYGKDAFYPAEQAYLESPYIVRDFRGQNIVVRPFAYNPVTKTLRVYTNMTITMAKVSDNGENQKSARKSNIIKTTSEYKAAYERRFINFETASKVYPYVEDNGEMLVICADQFVNGMMPLVNWKNISGRPTTIVSVTEAGGNSDTGLKNYIKSVYDDPDRNLAYVLFVGDYNHITPHALSGERSDNWFGQLEGTDHYPEVFIGRFSAETDEHIATQVNKVLYYERDLQSNVTWVDKGMGIGYIGAGSGHYGEDDYEHIDLIRDTLEHYTYSHVTEHHGGYGGDASTTTISATINQGISIINYCNHGSQDSWGVAGYSSSNVHALVNDNMLPIVWSVACLNGQFNYGSECFAEAWMRATNNSTGTPTGAIGGMFSWMSQPWQPPMYGQDEMVDILTEWNHADQYNHTLAGASLNGNMNVIDKSGDTECHDTWILFGDPSLMVRTANPTEMNVTINPSTLLIGMTELGVTVDADYAIATLSLDGEVLSSIKLVGGEGTLEFEPLTTVGNAELVIMGYNRVTYDEEVEIIPADGAFVTVNGFTPNFAPVNQETNMSMSFKNVGTDPTSGNTEVVLTCEDSRMQIINGTANLNVMQGNEVVTLDNAFSFIVAEGVEDGTKFTINVTMTCGSDVWNGKAVITAGQAILAFDQFMSPAGFVPGQTVTVAASFKNIGHYMATNAAATIASTSQYVTIAEDTKTLGTIAPDGVATAVFTITIDETCPETEVLPFTFNATADGGLTAEGSGSLKNSCNVLFVLNDEYGDGWNGSKLHIVYDDGTPAEDITLDNGNTGTFTREIGNNVHVTVTFLAGSWSYECTYVIKYEDGTVIHEENNQGGCNFTVNCGGSPISDFDPVEDLASDVDSDNGIVTLTWTAPENAISYAITRNGIALGETEETSYVDDVPQSGNYTYGITAVYAGGVSIPTTIVVTVPSGVGIDENEVEFSVYPNPANDVIYVNAGTAEVEYGIFNSIGQMVMSGKAQGLTHINVSELSNGLYIIRLCSSNNVKAMRITIK
ncbi:MAG: C25 family cysteine peptidase [Bacteroidales bacterium]|nr:C25 family cysteine peptidase [Bacteroidales bacterium]